MTFYQAYSDELHKQLSAIDFDVVDAFVAGLFKAWKNQQRVFICGNGGSAANAIHLANDFNYGVNPQGRALDAEALTANSSVVTCLANDINYESVFSFQLITKAKPADILIVLSGSGNSKNIVEALKKAKELGVTSYALVGFSGGTSKKIADFVLHSAVDDMQISEDIQVVIGHWLMRKLNELILNYDE